MLSNTVSAERESQRGGLLGVHQDCISPKCCSWRHVPHALPASHSPAPGQLCLGIFSSVPWESAVEGLGVHEGWSVLKNHRLKAKEQAIPWCPKSSKAGQKTSLAQQGTPLGTREEKEIG